jgi:Protein of unknown function (DUF2442)
VKRITDFQVRDDHRIWLRFDDGVEGIVNLSRLVGQGVFAAWRDYDFFKQAFLAGHGALAWPGDIDLCPDALYLEVTGKQPEDLFPILKTLAG